MAKTTDPRNERAFRLATSQLLSSYTNAADREASQFSRRIIEIATKHQRNLFLAMGGKVSFPSSFGVEKAPSFLQRSSFYRNWNDLSSKYKSSKGGKNEFWKSGTSGSSSLASHIIGQDAIDILGAPRVKTSGTGSLNKGYDFDRAGRPRQIIQRRDGSRGLGRFAAYRDAFRPGSVSYVAKVEIFQGLRGRKMAEVLHDLAGPDQQIRNKLIVTEFGRKSTNGKSVNHPERPLFRPFIQYYGDVLMPQLIEQDLKET